VDRLLGQDFIISVPTVISPVFSFFFPGVWPSHVRAGKKVEFSGLVYFSSQLPLLKYYLPNRCVMFMPQYQPRQNKLPFFTCPGAKFNDLGNWTWIRLSFLACADSFLIIILTTIFVDTRHWKTKHLQKRFQNFRQSYVLSTCRIEIHQSQPLVWPSDLLYVMLVGCDWWISIRYVDNM